MEANSGSSRMFLFEQEGERYRGGVWGVRVYVCVSVCGEEWGGWRGGGGCVVWWVAF